MLGWIGLAARAELGTARDAGLKIVLREAARALRHQALLFEKLPGLRHRGVQQVSLVAHSMGGLVCREMLTNPAMAYAESAREGDVP